MTRPNQQAELEAKKLAAIEQLDKKKVELELKKKESAPTRRERALHLVESQQIRQNTQILKERAAELSLQIKLKEREEEEIEDMTKTTIQVYKQKVKHHLHTHANDIRKIKEDKESAQKSQAIEHLEAIKKAESDAQQMSDEYVNDQVHHASQVKGYKDEVKITNSRFKETYEKQFKAIEDEQNENLESLYEDYNLQRINELHEIQERKDHHINRLIKNHKKAFQEMKNFYNKITQDHLTYISQYEAEHQAIEARFLDYEKRKKENEFEILKLEKDSIEKKEENNRLHKTLSTYENDKLALANSRSRLSQLELEIKSLINQHQIKESKFKQLEQERDLLIEKFEASVHDVKQKTEFRALLLEKKVETLGELLKKKEGNLIEMIDTSNIPQETVSIIFNEVDDLLRAKNAVIDNLEYELAKATKAHNDLIMVYKAKLSNSGVPNDELDFELRPSGTTSAPAPSMFK